MPRLSLKALLSVVVTISLLMGGCKFVTHVVIGPVVSPRLLDKVTPGLSKQEVVVLLGPPNKKYGENAWCYTRLFNPGWVEVYFDDKERVAYVNDESVIPPHQR